MIKVTDWTQIGAIATCVIAVGMFIAILQLYLTKQNLKVQQAANLLAIFKEIRNPETKKTLRLVYSLTFDANSNELKYVSSEDKLTSEELNEINNLLDRLELLGLLSCHGLISQSKAIEGYGGAPVRVWYKLNEYIKYERRHRGSYAEHLQEFVRRSIKYQVQYQPREKWTHLHSENLIEKLSREFNVRIPKSNRKRL